MYKTSKIIGKYTTIYINDTISDSYKFFFPSTHYSILIWYANQARLV